MIRSWYATKFIFLWSQNLAGNEVEALEEVDHGVTKLSVNISKSERQAGDQLGDVVGDSANGFELGLDLCAGENVMDELVDLGFLEGLELVDDEVDGWIKASEDAIDLESSVESDRRGGEGSTQEGENGGCGEELHFDLCFLVWNERVVREGILVQICVKLEDINCCVVRLKKNSSRSDFTQSYIHFAFLSHVI